MLTNIHNPSQEGSFHSERECNKTRHVVDCNCHMVSVDKEDRLAYSYSSDMEMDYKAVFPSVRSGSSEQFILLASCSGKNISHRHL